MPLPLARLPVSRIGQTTDPHEPWPTLPGCGETERIAILPNIDADGNPLRYEAGVAEPKAEAAE